MPFAGNLRNSTVSKKSRYFLTTAQKLTKTRQSVFATNFRLNVFSDEHECWLFHTVDIRYSTVCVW